MHPPGDPRAVGAPGHLLERQCVRVGAQQQRRTRIDALQVRDNTGASDPNTQVQAKLAQTRGDELGRLVLGERQLRLLMQPATSRDQSRLERHPVSDDLLGHETNIPPIDRPAPASVRRASSPKPIMSKTHAARVAS
jgi:hypothetical protein